jgi:hypothetical protein
MTVPGIDVSSHQPADYSTAGLGFVVVKATEGTTYTNPKYHDQIARARADELVLGHYHYLSPTSPPTAQVDHFLAVADLRPGEFLALDWEETGVSCAEKDQALRHLVEKVAGHRALLYCNLTYQRDRNTSGYVADGLWLARYNGHPGEPGVDDWVIHQYASTPLDTNVARFADVAAMRAWAGVTPPAKPKPKQPVTKADRTPTLHAPKWPGRNLRYVPGKPLMHGADVRTWQARMAKRGWNIDADGYYGPASAEVARQFQTEKHLGVDGIVGPKTWAAAWTTPITN